MSRVRLARNEEKIAFTLLHNHDKEMFSCNGNVDDFWLSEWGVHPMFIIQSVVKEIVKKKIILYSG